MAETLWRTKLFLLVYTVPDDDWSWGMWEAGVALGAEGPDTRLVVFQCGKNAPAVSRCFGN